MGSGKGCPLRSLYPYRGVCDLHWPMGGVPSLAVGRVRLSMACVVTHMRLYEYEDLGNGHKVKVRVGSVSVYPAIVFTLKLNKVI